MNPIAILFVKREITIMCAKDKQQSALGKIALESFDRCLHYNTAPLLLYKQSQCVPNNSSTIVRRIK